MFCFAVQSHCSILPRLSGLFHPPQDQCLLFLCFSVSWIWTAFRFCLFVVGASEYSFQPVPVFLPVVHSEGAAGPDSKTETIWDSCANLLYSDKYRQRTEL